MKKLFGNRRLVALTVAGAALMTAGLARAQQGNGHPDLRARTQTRVASFLNQMGKGARDLHLTHAQKTKLKTYARKHFPEARAILASPDLTREQKIAKVHALRTGAQDILTPAQQKKAEALKGQALAGVFDQLQWVSEELDLSAEQEGKIRNIVASAVQQGAKAHLEAKAGPPDFAAIRGAIVRTQGEINAVLTPAQQSKWAVIRSAAQTEFLKRFREWRAQVA